MILQTVIFEGKIIDKMRSSTALSTGYLFCFLNKAILVICFYS